MQKQRRREKENGRGVVRLMLRAPHFELLGNGGTAEQHERNRGQLEAGRGRCWRRRGTSTDSAVRASNRGPAVTRTIQGPASRVRTSIGPAIQPMIRSAASSWGNSNPEAAGESPRASHSAPARKMRLTVIRMQPAAIAAAT